jgi:hypothetical protein
MPVPVSVDAPESDSSGRPRVKRHLRRRSDRLIRLIAVMAIFGGIVVSAVMWQQSTTIARQRELIKVIFQDSLELNKMKQRELRQKQEDKKHTSGDSDKSAGPYADGCMAHRGPCT